MGDFKDDFEFEDNSAGDFSNILVTTSPYLEGYKVVKYLDIVSATGSTDDVIKHYPGYDMMEIAHIHMMYKALDFGANAVINIRYAPTEYRTLAYGTAVVVEKI